MTNVTDTAKTTKSALLLLVLAADPAAHAKFVALGRKATKLLLGKWLDAQGTRTMAQTLLRYRAGYQDTVSSSNRPSLHNGDPVAKFLEGRDPSLVMAAAERILGLEAGFLTTKYASLNPGQQRMNSGNRIRAALKRGDITASQLTLAA